MNAETRINKLLIIGGSGFLGRAVLRELADTDPLLIPENIWILDRKPLTIEPVYEGLPIHYVEGDIRDADVVENACRGTQIVLHLASLIDWGTHPTAEVFDINVTGTRNVVTACQKTGVGVLVYTSSLDAIFPGRSLMDADETVPYPEPFTGPYAETKALAETSVCEANGDALKTVVIRPSGIYGEADPYHLRELARFSRSGLFIRIGSPECRCMHIYVGNVAHGHLLAARNLWEGNNRAAGQKFFLVDSEPENFFAFLAPILEQAGLRLWPRNLWIPGWALYPFALMTEGVTRLLRPFCRIHPSLSRFALSYLCCSFTLKGDRAASDLEFVPKYPVEEAKRRTADWFRTNGF